MNKVLLSRRELWLVAAVLVCACCLLAPVSAFAASAPTVTAVSPASGPMTGGTSVTVSGTGFAGATAVKFGSQSATSYTVNSDGSITATAPQNVAALYNGAANSGKGALAYSGSVDVTVTTSAGTSATSSADQFTYNWTLTVDNGSQRKVYSLSDLEAMTPVYSGYGGFLKGDPPYTVYQYTGTTLLNLLADSGGYTSGKVQFGTADNYASAPYTFSDVTDPFDNFGANDPATGNPLGTDPGLSVVMTYGTGSPWALLPTTIGPEIALLSPAATQVTSGSLWPHFLTSITTPTAIPAVTGVSPAGGAATGGTAVTITGTNLGSVATVKFGSVAAAGFLVNSQTQITAVAPAEAAGTVDVTVSAPTGASATSTADDFTYAQPSLAGATIAAISDQTYTGAAITPALTVTFNGATLTAGTDYTVGYANNIAVGSASATITGIGNYSGTQTVSFNVVPLSVTGATIAAIPDQSYTGSAITPAPIVTYGATSLVNSVDYTVSYANNTALGTASVTITGKGNYTGTKTVSFSIVPLSIASATIAAIPDQTYTGAAITPALTVTLNGATLVQGIDYTVVYAGNTAAGTATATILGQGLQRFRDGQLQDRAPVGDRRDDRRHPQPDLHRRGDHSDACRDLRGRHARQGRRLHRELHG